MINWVIAAAKRYGLLCEWSEHMLYWIVVAISWIYLLYFVIFGIPFNNFLFRMITSFFIVIALFSIISIVRHLLKKSKPKKKKRIQ